MNPSDAMMISTLISFEGLQNINLCLSPGKMNGYAEDPGQTLLLKISKIVVKKIFPNLTLLAHSLVSPNHPPRSQFRSMVVEIYQCHEDDLEGGH